MGGVSSHVLLLLSSKMAARSCIDRSLAGCPSSPSTRSVQGKVYIHEQLCLPFSRSSRLCLTAESILVEALVLGRIMSLPGLRSCTEP